MANVHNTFIEFNNRIYSTPEKRRILKDMRRAIKTDIKQYFKANRGNYSVKLKEQGYFSTKTTILPIDGEYDVGVYISGTEENRPTPEIAHNWIVKAMKNRTNQNTIDKKTFVRVKCAKSYHIDLPIYYKSTDSDDENLFPSSDVPKLAHKTKGWIETEPYAFKRWFKKGLSGKSQLKRIMRYLKAWSDNKSHLKLPSGMVFTVLAVNNYEYHDRDDKAFLQTLKNIQEKIDSTRSIWAYYVCKRPSTDQDENLLNRYSSAKRKRDFLDALNNIIISGEKAIEHKSEKDACEIWQKYLGNKFGYSNSKEYDEIKPKHYSFPRHYSSANF